MIQKRIQRVDKRIIYSVRFLRMQNRSAFKKFQKYVRYF